VVERVGRESESGEGKIERINCGGGEDVRMRAVVRHI
jgi:hypothetical protein